MSASGGLLIVGSATFISRNDPLPFYGLRLTISRVPSQMVTSVNGREKETLADPKISCPCSLALYEWLSINGKQSKGLQLIIHGGKLKLHAES